MLSQGAWAVIQNLGRQGVSFSIFIILSRLLSPKDFGVLGMAASWVGIVNAFSEIGFSAAIIQRKKIEEKHLSTTFFANVSIGVILFIVGIAMSIPAAIFFKTPEVSPVIAVLSVSFLVNSLALTQMAIAQRELRFKDLAIRDLSASLIGGIVGITMALFGFGVWSLVVQILITGITSSFLLWHFVKWRPNYKKLSLESIKELWPYSSKIFYFNIFKYFAQNTDKLLIGYFLGSVALGFYTFTFKVVVFPITAFVGSVGSYLFPKYSKIQDDINGIKISYIEINKIIGAIIAPVLFFVIIVSPFLVPILVGKKWNSALPLFPIMAIVAILQSLISPVGNLLKATDRPGWMLNWSFFITVMASMLMIAGVKHGIIGVAVGLATAYVIGFFVNIYILKKIIFLSYSDIVDVYLKKLIPIFAVVGIVFWATVNDFIQLSFNNLALALVISAIYIITFCRLNYLEIGILRRKIREGIGF